MKCWSVWEQILPREFLQLLPPSLPSFLLVSCPKKKEGEALWPLAAAPPPPPPMMMASLCGAVERERETSQAEDTLGHIC